MRIIDADKLKKEMLEQHNWDLSREWSIDDIFSQLEEDVRLIDKQPTILTEEKLLNLMEHKVEPFDIDEPIQSALCDDIRLVRDTQNQNYENRKAIESEWE